jgi:hypothetical protein
MVNYGKKTIILKDPTTRKIVLEDIGRPRKIVFEEKGKIKRIIIEGDEEDEKSLQTVVIREGVESKPRRKVVLMVALAAIPALIALGYSGWQFRPRDPILEIKSVTVSGFSLHTSTESALLASLDLDVTIYVLVQNPNVTPITFHAAVMEIFYRGTRLGQLQVPPGGQGPQSEQIISLPCRMSGLKATHHLKELLSDVANREMVLHAKCTVTGDIAVWIIRHHYEVYVKSEIKIDPVFLDIIDQRHRADINIRGVAVPWVLDK